MSVPSVPNQPLAHTVANAVQVSGVSRSSLYEAIKAGDLPVRKAGRRTLILHADLAAWLQTLPVGRSAERSRSAA
jgi:excisionase family DNA binding protein